MLPEKKGHANWGGFRPGAGRKAGHTVTYQETMRDAFERVCTFEEWSAVILRAVEDAKKGNKFAREWLTPWIVGKQPDTVVHMSDNEAPMRMVIEVEYVGKSGIDGERELPVIDQPELGEGEPDTPALEAPPVT